MFSRCLSILVFGALALHAKAGNALRVCADPNNLPFSNDKEQGLENRLASLVAAALGQPLEYTWWAERKSFIKSSLQAGKCDVVMGLPAASSSVAVTRPYYRSTYVTVTRQDRNLAIKSLLDDALEHCRIGVHVVGDDYAPPALVLARRGLTANIVGYSLFGADDVPNPPSQIIDAVRKGDIDVAIVWGPFAGYFAQGSDPAFDIEPVSPSTYFGSPFTYEIAVAVRSADTGLRDRIDQVLASKHDAVQALLREFRIPQVKEAVQ